MRRELRGESEIGVRVRVPVRLECACMCASERELLCESLLCSIYVMCVSNSKYHLAMRATTYGAWRVARRVTFMSRDRLMPVHYYAFL